MSVKRIAFCGVFDLENYGDHLFPLIFERECEKRNINVELTLFSPFYVEHNFFQSGPVFKVTSLAEKNEEKAFDAIVIGGGEILHLNTFKHKLNYESNSFVNYPIYDVWTIPSLVARKYKIPLLWNNPGCPFEFKDSQVPLVKYILDSVDYISVRNQYSLDCLKKVYPDIQGQFKLSVDTAFSLHNIYPKACLKKHKEKLFDFNKYIVFHSNHLLSEYELKKTVTILSTMKQQGYEIVLLPLAYTNEDDVFMKNINAIASGEFFTFDKHLSIIEIISILAHASVYIGVSFHGAITSAVYGNKVIAHDFFQNKKTKDLFEMMGLSNFYCTNIEDVCVKFKEIDTFDSTQIKNVENEAKKHFDQIIESIINIENKNKNYSCYEILSELITQLSLEEQNYLKDRQKLLGEVQYNLLNWQKCANEIEQLYQENSQKKSFISKFRKN